MLGRALDTLWERISAPIDPRPLALVRIALGTAALLKALEVWVEYHSMVLPSPVRAPYFEAVPDWALGVVPFVLVLWSGAAIALTLGWRTRLAAASVAASGFSVLLLDQRLYGSHFYLLCLLNLILAFSDAGACTSLDARRRHPRAVAAGPVLLLKIQLSLVYGFTAVAKVNPVFLSGELLDGVIRWAALPAGLAGLRGPVLLTALAWFVVLLEAYLSVALWLPKLRPSAFVLGLGLHAFIVFWVGYYHLQLLIFALETLSLYLLFLEAGPRSRTVVWDDSAQHLNGWVRALSRLDWLGVHRFVPRSDREALLALGFDAAGPTSGLRVVGPGFEAHGVAALRSILRVLPVSFLWAPVLDAVAHLWPSRRRSKVLRREST